MISGFEKALLGVLVLVLMAGMGATLSVDQFRQIRRRPKAVLIGVASQFGWMPLIAFALARGLQLPEPITIGLILIGCTPGGTTSNLFTYYSRADVALSVSMTATSTVVAVLLMPLLFTLYTSGLASSAIASPVGKMVQTLVVILVPVAIGMGVRVKWPNAAPKLEKAGSFAGVATLALLVGSSLLRNGDLLFDTTTATYVAAAGLGILGMGLGYGVSKLLGMQEAQRRSIAFETGIQNSPLAFTIIIASFPEADQAQLLHTPMLYALLVLVTGTLATLLFRSVQKTP